MACLLNSHHRKRMAMRILVDVSCIITVSVGIFSVRFGAEPYHRGFFCDDESIKHPVLSDTISVPVAVVVGLLVPIVMIIAVEMLLRNENEKFCMISKDGIFTQRKSWIVAAYNYIVVFIFGMGINEFLTEVGKVSIGRLRPHFLTLCAPDFSKIDCTQGYITANVCTSADSAKLRNARLSFPSGHSSFSMYCMMYSMLYLQARVSCKFTILLKPLILVIFFSMGFYTCLSRISDYMHHWSDVLAGAILGMVVCICVVKGLTDLGPNLCGGKLSERNRIEQLESVSNNHKSIIATSHFESTLSSTSAEDPPNNSHVVNLEDVAY